MEGQSEVPTETSIEKRLHEIEHSYFVLFNSVTEAIYVHKDDGIFLDVNEGAIKMYGYQREELIGRTPELVSAPGRNDVGQIMRLMKQVVSTGRSERFEFWGQRKNGDIFLKDVIMNKGKYYGEDVIISTARDITERKNAELLLQTNTYRLEKINQCLSSLGPDYDSNISRLTALCGELLSATCALFNRLNQGLLCSFGQWQTPPDHIAKDAPEGHICYDVISGKEDEEAILITDLQNTSYALSDPNVRAYGLQTYFGRVVKCGGRRIGSLCVVYKEDYAPTDEDKRILGIIASAIGNEDMRNQAEMNVTLNEAKYRSLFNDSAVAIFEEDFSELKTYFDNLKAAGFSDLRTYFDDHPNEVFTCSSMIRIIDVNNECLKLFQIREKSELLHINHSTFSDGSWQVFKNELISLSEGNLYFESTLPVFDYKGDRKEVIFKLKVSEESKHTLKRVIVSLIDITDLKKAEESLKESNDKYKNLQNLFRIIADNMPDMIWAKDLENKYIFTNKAMCENLLMAKDTFEPVGKTDMFFAERERSLHSGNPHWHTFGEICRDSDTIVLKSGKTQQFDESGNVRNKFLFLEVIKTPLYNEQNEIIGTVGAGRDITDRKRSEQIQKVLFTITNAVINTKDLVEFIMFIKEQLGTLIDTTNFYVALYDEFTGMLTTPYYCDEKDNIITWPAENSATGYVIKNKRSFLLRSDEIKKLRENGVIGKIGAPSLIWVGVPLFLEDSVKGAIVVQSYTNPNAFNEKDVEMLEFISHQISLSIQRKKAVEEIHILNRDLEKRVAERTRELQAINDELEAFSYSVSHDLRAPLRAIDGFTQILFEDYESLLDEKGKNICTIIRQNTFKMNQLINDLLNFSRITRAEMDMTVFTMNEMVKKSFHDISTQQNRDKISFSVDQFPEVKGDKAMLQQVWTNLISNAVKFSSAKVNPVIIIKCTTNSDEFVFSIKDNGAGFDMKYVNKLFGVFQRLHSTKQFEGTGVGLAIVQRIIQRHGGRVWAEGNVEKGATFYFTLPFPGQ